MVTDDEIIIFEKKKRKKFAKKCRVSFEFD